jgi:hypothetical protein
VLPLGHSACALGSTVPESGRVDQEVVVQGLRRAGFRGAT